MVFLEMGPNFPGKNAKIMILSSILWPPGTLNRIHRIQRIQRIQRKRNQRCGTDPGFPTPGARMTVVYTNFLKSADPFGVIRRVR